MTNMFENNYRQVECCPNCKYCYDSGIDEEYLECEEKDSLYRIPVSHDYICDKYSCLEN
jgi:hypothetical protein